MNITKKKAIFFLVYWTGSHDDFLLLGRRLYQLSITNGAKHSSQTYRRAGQHCFGLLVLISRPHVRYIHLPKRKILPRSLIPSHKYILKSLTLWYVSTRVFTTLVKSFTYSRKRLITRKKQCPSWPIYFFSY